MKVLLFGITKEIAGQDVLDIPAGIEITNVKELKAYLRQEYPGLGRLSSLAVAVNKQYATEEVKIQIADELALIPPVSGG